MPRPPGRDQTAPMERLVRLIGALTLHPQGAPVSVLLRVVDGDEATDESRRRMLTRDLGQLNALGYDIRNLAEPGTEGRFVMRARDNRLQVHLSAEQRGELLRAALSAGLEEVSAHLGGHDHGHHRTGDRLTAAPGAASGGALDDTLDKVTRGVTRRCLIRFDYKGQHRTVHPVRVHSGPSGWYLSGREAGSGAGSGESRGGTNPVKEFVVSRMSAVALDAPGTADAVTAEPRPSLDPLGWRVDPPTEVVVEVPAEHRRLVENLLGTPVDESRAAGGLRLTYVVTNRAVLRWRLYELGTRVRVVSPEAVRAELVAELESFLAGAS